MGRRNGRSTTRSGLMTANRKVVQRKWSYMDLAMNHNCGFDGVHE
ncbi:hypothetical protein HMPREF9621_00578 [Cutibacterium modestum HL037PA2]|nr:hypothetical protein HMPREF9621_00578 [Cutibacterium modestum HL037PA2]